MTRQATKAIRNSATTTAGKKRNASGSNAQQAVQQPPPVSLFSKSWLVWVFALGVLISVVHAWHVSQLFENDRHFSHLADFEREMTYRTEMGLYYSYYKTLISTRTFSQGLRQITHDNVTEFGHTINTLKRFNLYPEVILAAMYRFFKGFCNQWGISAQTCWQVNRGKGMQPVESCEGIGNAHYFYIDGVFAIAGTVAGSIFILGCLLGESMLGGLVAVAAFFFNHGEATRVQWTPPLRESFAFPLLFFQALLVSYAIKQQRYGAQWAIAIAIPTTFSMLFWQFSQFALSTQIGSLFVVFVLDAVPFATMKTLISAHMLAFFSSLVLLFGNPMLLTSFYLSAIISMMVLLFLEPVIGRITLRLIYLSFSAGIFLLVTFGLRAFLAKTFAIEDDSIQKLCNTLLIPTAGLSVLILADTVISTERQRGILSRPVRQRGRPYAEALFCIVQLACYTIMALLIMRLKLFMSPQLCVVAGLVANVRLWQEATGWKISAWTQRAAIAGLLAAMAYHGLQNLRQQHSISGEYSNPDQEALFDWIQKHTAKDAVFGGTMPVMANVKLSTGRPIVNHPHYEDAGIRARTIKIYSMFSRKPIEEVHKILKDMGVNYFVFQPMNCGSHAKPECSYRGMWDLQDPVNRHRRSLCDIFEESLKSKKVEGIRPFQLAYNQRGYIVFAV